MSGNASPVRNESTHVFYERVHAARERLQLSQ